MSAPTSWLSHSDDLPADPATVRADIAAGRIRALPIHGDSAEDTPEENES